MSLAEDFVGICAQGDFEGLVEFCNNHDLIYPHVLNEAHIAACKNMHSEVVDFLGFALCRTPWEWKTKPKNELNDAVTRGDLDTVKQVIARGRQLPMLQVYLRARELAYGADNKDMIEVLNTAIVDSLCEFVRFQTISGRPTVYSLYKTVQHYQDPDFGVEKPKPKPKQEPATDCKVQ
jgi:hypothetical protein